MNFIFKKDNSKSFTILWQEYIDKNTLSYEYDLNILEYNLSCINIMSDESFVIEENNQCVGICFLPISSPMGYIIAPHSNTDKIEKKLFTKVDEICINYDVKELKLTLSIFEDFTFNKLSNYQFIDTSISTCSIDLNSSQKKMWIDIRQSYKSLINGFIRNDAYTITYSSSENMQELHNTYVDFHKKHMEKAGKLPKDKIIYDKQYDLLKSDVATIIAIKFNDKIIFTNYFFHSNDKVTYASSAYDLNEEFKQLPLNHYLLWKAILYFKDLGFSSFNFGTPCGYNKINGFEDYLDDKQINISSFKRGMGAKMYTQYQGIRFYDKSLLLEKIETFKVKVNQVIF